MPSMLSMHACVTDIGTHRWLLIPLKCQNKQWIGQPTGYLCTCPVPIVYTSHRTARPLISAEPTQHWFALIRPDRCWKKPWKVFLPKICHRNWSLFVILPDKISQRGTSHSAYIDRCGEDESWKKNNMSRHHWKVTCKTCHNKTKRPWQFDKSFNQQCWQWLPLSPSLSHSLPALPPAAIKHKTDSDRCTAFVRSARHSHFTMFARVWARRAVELLSFEYVRVKIAQGNRRAKNSMQIGW